MKMHEVEKASNVDESRSFDRTQDPELRKYLEGFYKTLPAKELFSNSEIEWLNYSYEGSGISAKVTDIQHLHLKVNLFKTIPRERIEGPGKFVRVFYTREQVLAFAALTFHTAPFGFRLFFPNSNTENVTELKKRLGEDPLSELLTPPNHRTKGADTEPKLTQNPENSKKVHSSDSEPDGITSPISSPKEYLLRAVTEADLTSAAKWTKEYLDQQIPQIRNEMGLASYSAIPYDIAKIIVTVTALKENVQKNPEKIMDDLTYQKLKEAFG